MTDLIHHGVDRLDLGGLAFGDEAVLALPYLLSGIKISSTVHVLPSSAVTGFEATIPLSILRDLGNPGSAAANAKVLFLYADIGVSCVPFENGMVRMDGTGEFVTYYEPGLFLRNHIALLLRY